MNKQSIHRKDERRDARLWPVLDKRRVYRSCSTAAAMIIRCSRQALFKPPPAIRGISLSRALSATPPPGQKAADRATLVGGRASVSKDPARDMIGWAHDAQNDSLVAAAGHRRWLLNPFATYMSYGQVHGYAAQKVFGFDEEPVLAPQIEVDYIAFPYETYPFHLVGEGAPWSFSVIEDKRNIWANQYPYFENAHISVVRTSDEASLVITGRYTDTDGFGVPNLLSWQVEGWEYDTLYEVEISNVTLRNGVTRSYSYPVFIDRANIEY